MGGVTPSGDSAPTGQPVSGNSAVFNPNAAAISAASTYDSFGLPTGMGTQRVYVGYVPQYESGNADGADFSDQRKGAGKMPTIARDISNKEVTVEDLLKHYRTLATSTNPASRQAWKETQEQLQAMDAYGSDKRINYGAWSPKDSAALKFALDGYLQGGKHQMMTFEKYVKQAAQQGAANGLDQNQPGGPGSSGGGQQRAPLSVTNTADLNQAADNTDQAMLGRAATSGEQGQFADQFHGQEQASYDAAAGSTPYAAPASAADAARQFVLSNNLPEYAQHQAESYLNVFANMFLSGNSSRANTSLGDAAVGGK